MIGEKLSPILEEISITLLENYETKPQFTMEGFKAGLFIFSSVVLDKLFDFQEKENIPLDIREDMAVKCGSEIRELVKKYCNIDPHELQ